MNQESRVWTQIIMHSLIPGLYFTDVTKDRVCLIYALRYGRVINFGAMLMSSMRKDRVYIGHRYTFGDLNTIINRILDPK